jgi:nucleoside-diphosphate-sugar epimerase
MSATNPPPAPELFTDEWSKDLEADVASLAGPILVIGASGFIGARLFYSLARRRKDVYAASRDPFTSWRLARLPPFVDPQQIIQVDLTHAEQLREKLERFKPRTVFNLSAYGAYERQQQAKRIHEVNYTGTLNLILGLREVGCDAMVQAGSSSEYGLNCAGPKEDGELVPNSDYAVSKVAASYLLRFYGKIHDFPCTHLRLYSVYGPFEERDRLIPRVLQAGLEGLRAGGADVQDRARAVVQYRDWPAHHAGGRRRARQGRLRARGRPSLRSASQPPVGSLELVRRPEEGQGAARVVSDHRLPPRPRACP